MFDSVPQTVFGICGFGVRIDEDEDSKFSNPYEKYTYKSPPTIGGRVYGYATKTTLTIDGVAFDFGRAKGVFVDVCFESCSITPGTGPLIHAP